VIVQAVPGQPERLPQTVSSGAKEVLMITSTPGAPPVQVSVPRRSVAPMILETTETPG